MRKSCESLTLLRLLREDKAVYLSGLCVWDIHGFFSHIQVTCQYSTISITLVHAVLTQDLYGYVKRGKKQTSHRMKRSGSQTASRRFNLFLNRGPNQEGLRNL